MDHVNVIFERDPLALDDEFSNESTQQSEDNLYCCQVCNMILIGFHKYTPEEQAEIIRKGRPVPQLDNLVITTSTGKKSFCSKRYEYDEWLTGCKQRSKLYCWPCLLFSERIDPWTTTGISDINNLACSTKSHSTWDIHIDAMFKWKTFGKTSPNIGGDDEEFSDHEESDQILKEEEIMKNRKIIKKFVHIVCFLGVHELCLSEEERDDLKDPIDQMKYETFINYIGKYDHFLASQCACNEVFLSTSFRNNLISSVTNIVTRYIYDEILQSSFVSMILDEVAEMNDTILISTILRFTNAKGELIERFLNFRSIPSDRKADSLFSLIYENLNILECASKLVSISCDGGVIKTNELFEFQAKIRAICPNTSFLHYYEHRVNTVLAQSLSNIEECKLFFWTLNGLAMSFFKSKKLRDELDILIRKNKPDSFEFRWNFNGSLINNVLGIRQHLIDLFQSILDHTDGWDFESVSASNWFLPKLKSDLSFNFLLLLLGDIFERTDVLSSNLVLNSDNIELCIQHVKEYTNFIKYQKRTFDFVYNNALGLIISSEVSAKRKKDIGTQETYSSESCELIFQNVLSNIITQLNARFSDLWKTKFISLITNSENSKLNTIHLGNLYLPFKESFDMPLLVTELSVLGESKAIKKTNQKEILKTLRTMDLSSTFPQTTKLCELSTALPITEGKSTLERVENYIQTTSLKHRLSIMAVLKIEKEFILELSKNPKFYDKIIEELSDKEPFIPLIHNL